MTELTFFWTLDTELKSVYGKCMRDHNIRGRIYFKKPQGAQEDTLESFVVAKE